jgi:3-oxoacyl-[acyl-carrier-protein] synthase II
MKDRRVVITGVGPVSAIGVGREEFAASLRERCSGIDAVSLFDASPYRAGLAAEVADFEVEDYLESQKTYLDRATELAFAAVSLAIEDADLNMDNLDRERTALLLGSAGGSLETMAMFFADFVNKGPRLVKPFLFPHTYSNTAISLIAIEYDLRGHHLNFASGATASAQAILEGYHCIRSGRCDAAFAGGYEAFNEVLFASRDILGELSPATEPGAVSGPFGAQRDGYVLGEGAAVLFLESLEHARARGARVLGEVLGGADGGASDVTKTDRSAALYRVMASALEHADLEPAQLDLVMAAANGNVETDAAEAGALRRLIENGAQDVAVSTPKEALGETLGADAALRSVAALEAIASGSVPGPGRPVDEALGLTDNLLARPEPISSVLVNSVDPGGGAAVVVIGAGDASE